MAVHRAAKMGLMPGVQHAARKRRAYDPLLDDSDLYPTPEEIAALPDPAPLIPAIATLVLEVIAGARSVDQVASWYRTRFTSACVARLPSGSARMPRLGARR